MLPTVHYNMGGIPTNYHGEVLTLKNGDPDTIVPGLMAVGEAACVSVHGANRLGSNSLIDLVVFGRAAGLRCAETRRARREARRPARQGLPPTSRCRGSTASATPMAARRPPSCACRMQKTMQTNCAVFRTGEVLEEGHKLIHDVWKGADDIQVTDRSLIWNSDLIETLEYDNLIVQAVVTMDSARQPQGEPRRACARGLPQARRRQLDEAHAGLGRRRRRARCASTTARAHLHDDQRGRSTSSRRRGCTEEVQMESSLSVTPYSTR